MCPQADATDYLGRGLALNVDHDAIRGGLLLTIANFSTAVAGALFWFLLARLTGIGSIGAASSIVSAAMIPAAVLGAGYGLAAARHVAARGPNQACGLLAFSLLLAAAAAASSAALAVFLEAGGYEEAAAALLGFLTTASGVGMQLLLGMKMFRVILAASIAANTAKLLVGVAAALAGFGEAAVLMGFAAFPAVGLAASTITIAARSGLGGCSISSLGEVRRLLGLGASNTLYASSSQLPVALGIYLYAALGGEPIDTGALYLAMMAAQVIAMPASSLAAATLPSSIQHGRAMALDTLRVGLAVAVPVAAVLAVSPQLFYSVFAPGLISRDNLLVLQLLAYTAPLLASLNTALIEFNRRATARTIAIVSAARLALTATLLPPLAATHGAPGAAAAFTAATAASLALAAALTPTVLLDALRAEAALLPSQLLQGSSHAAIAASILLSHTLLYPYTKLATLLYTILHHKARAQSEQKRIAHREEATSMVREERPLQ